MDGNLIKHKISIGQNIFGKNDFAGKIKCGPISFSLKQNANVVELQNIF